MLARGRILNCIAILQELFSGHVTPNVVVDPIYDEIGFNGSCIFTLYTTEDVLKTYEQFEGSTFPARRPSISMKYHDI